VAVDAGGTINGYNCECILGTSDIVHFLYHINAATIRQRALTSANVLQTESSVASTIASYHEGISYLNGATTKVVVGLTANGTNLNTLTFDSGNTPTTTNGGISSGSTNGNNFRLFSDGTDVYAIYNEATNGDIQINKSTDNGVTFDSAVVIYTGSIADVERNLSFDAGLPYESGWDYVYPYIINDAGTMYYNEYVLRRLPNKPSSGHVSRQAVTRASSY
jgi:hypothetical protein